MIAKNLSFPMLVIGSGIFAMAHLLMLESSASASVVTTTASGSHTAFDGDISTTDLIEGTTNLEVGSPTSTMLPYGTGYTIDGLHDGSAAATENTAFWIDGQGGSLPAVVTFTFDTATNTLGYKIDSIVGIAGFGSGAPSYAHQLYDISYSTVSAPATFIALTSVDYTPGADGSKVTLTDTTGTLATNVKSLQFSILNPGGGETAVIREFDVFGSAVTAAPEPTCLSMMACGLVGLAAFRRNRRKPTSCEK